VKIGAFLATERVIAVVVVFKIVQRDFILFGNLLGSSVRPFNGSSVQAVAVFSFASKANPLR
jgi:hypothetical protein